MYAVVELQKMNDTTLSHLTDSYQTINEAYSKYHTVLAAAAISTVPLHSAVILSETGDVLATEHFTHEETTESEA